MYEIYTHKIENLLFREINRWKKNQKNYCCSCSSTSLLFLYQRKPIKPTMAKGIIIKYKMPLFIPCAGFSPNCCAVLVQSEHWAFTAFVDISKTNKANDNMMVIFFIQVVKLTRFCQN